jgi:hypothetical protein
VERGGEGRYEAQVDEMFPPPLARRVQLTVSGDDCSMLPEVSVAGRIEHLSIEDPWRSRLVGAAVFVVLVGVLAAQNRYIFVDARFEDGDFAANSILIDKARHLRLLVGNYSRVGFNHPGPAFLYIQALSEVVLHDVVPVARSPFDAHVAGIVLLNATLVALASAVVYRRTGTLAAPVTLVAAVLVATSGEPGMVASTWMPHTYFCPFLLLLVAASSVVSGSPRDIWMVALAGGLLVHGHVSFVMFVGVIAGAAAVALVVYRVRREEWGFGRRITIVTAAIIALFALPVVANVVRNWPGEFGRYWAYSTETTITHSVGDAVAFVGYYWGPRWAPLVIAALVLAVALTWRSGDVRTFIAAGAGVVAVATALMVVYTRRGVDDLAHRYVGIFYLAVPILAATIVAAAVATRLRSLHPTVAAAAVAGAISVALVAARPQLTNAYPGAGWLPATYETINRQAPEGIIAVRVVDWPTAAGVVEYARRQGREVCIIENPALTFIFTAALTCTPQQLGNAHLFTVGPQAVSASA